MNTYLIFSIENFNRQTLNNKFVQRHCIQSFLISTHEIIDDLEAIIPTEGHQVYRKIVHKLKGSVSLFCNNTLKKELTNLADPSITIDHNQYLNDVKKLIISLRQLLKEVQKFHHMEFESQNET